VGILETSKKPALVRRRDQISKTNPGPLLDRIDIHIELPRVDYEKLSGDRVGETGAAIRAHVQAARDIQQLRFTNTNLMTSSATPVCASGEIRQFCKLQDEGQSLMWAATSCCA